MELTRPSDFEEFSNDEKFDRLRVRLDSLYDVYIEVAGEIRSLLNCQRIKITRIKIGRDRNI